MMRHLMMLAWRRRGVNALLAAEIAGAFLVASLVATMGAQLLLDWRRPLGFDRSDIWVVLVRLPAGGGGPDEAPATMRLRSVLDAALASQHVAGAATATSVPWDSGEDNWQFDNGEATIDAEFNVVSDEFRDVMGLEIVEGRWFEDGDQAQSFRPVVVDRDFARALRPDGNAVGHVLPRSPSDEREMRVVGVVSDFRRNGEFASQRPYMFLRRRPDASTTEAYVLLKMLPGTPASAEPAVLAPLRLAAPGAEIGVRQLDAIRERSLRATIVPVAAAVLVAAFLLAMVVLGLVGVLWQNVSRRTREFALRRAVGATPGDIRALVLGELAVVTVASLIAGTLVVAQVPLPAMAPFIGVAARVLGLLAAGALVSLLVTCCGLQPSAQAMRAMPAEALRHE